MEVFKIWFGRTLVSTFDKKAPTGSGPPRVQRKNDHVKSPNSKATGAWWLHHLMQALPFVPSSNIQIQNPYSWWPLIKTLIKRGWTRSAPAGFLDLEQLFLQNIHGSKKSQYGCFQPEKIIIFTLKQQTKIVLFPSLGSMMGGSSCLMFLSEIESRFFHSF